MNFPIKVNSEALAVALAVTLGLYIWSRFTVIRLRRKLTASEEEAFVLHKSYEKKAATLIEANKAALADAEKSLAEELSAATAENERVRQHYQAEARKAFEESNRKLEAFASMRALAADEENVRNALASALREAEELRSQAVALISDAKARASVERDAALQKAKAIQTQAQGLLARATTESAAKIAEAEKRAQEIAGEAYFAIREKTHLEESVRAIRNVIDGYGDRYIIPTRSLIDDLAVGFGHTEAGQALQLARQQSRQMVEEGGAAECDYVETNRRDTAVRFATDAFNGRVDAILTKVGEENIGTLRQKILDAFNLVNLNGAAFRNARIRQTYLDSRLSELKWACAAYELKLREREEQRRLREQIREEEKARKEYERALKESQREEEVIKLALEKARKEAEVAGVQEREKYAKRMAELEARLAEAEAKNQRALSMAQQTRKGNVYIISNVGSFGEGVFKIGMTRRLEPMERIWELGDASVPFEFDVHAIIPSDDAPALEGELHDAFEDLRINHVNMRKEFFRVSLEEVREIIAKRGISATFTMAAEAQEYRESQAIARLSPEERARTRMRMLGAQKSDAYLRGQPETDPSYN